jgi:hypothetical protein
MRKGLVGQAQQGEWEEREGEATRREETEGVAGAALCIQKTIMTICLTLAWLSHAL